jgi:hypothetical protein
MRGPIVMTLGLGVLLASAPQADAQVGYLWTYDELLRKADLVVIAQCRSTRDTGNQLSHPGLTLVPVVEMQTTFVVDAVVQSGDPNPVSVGSDLRLRHYRHDLERWRKEHPPDPGGLPRGLLNTGSTLVLEEKRSYLLFLIKSADGLYEPLSGHTFPTDSVYRLDNGRVR